jgi:predicted double-glycine peptidase
MPRLCPPFQRRDFSCGAACLATVGRYYWEDNVDEQIFLEALDEILTDEEIRDRIENGLAMTDLRRAAVLVGYQAIIGQTTFEKLGQVKVPMIVGISPGGHDHFVVLRGTDFDWVYIADPIRGNIRMPAYEFREQWQENAILVIHKPGREVRKSSPLSVREEETSLGELRATRCRRAAIDSRITYLFNMSSASRTGAICHMNRRNIRQMISAATSAKTSAPAIIASTRIAASASSS